MFCPNCKSIITKKRINNQILEFCNCPDKLESNYVAAVITDQKNPFQSQRRVSKTQIITLKEKNKKKFTTIQESTFKLKRELSDYTKLDIELKISKNARLPTFWKQKTIQDRLIQHIDEKYDRYYRKIEDYFADTDLQFFVSFVPNESLTDFTIDHWGLGFGNPDFKTFYAGTKLNDLASFESKVLEKEADVILPYRLFTNHTRKLDFDRLNLQQLVELLKSDWFRFKDSATSSSIRKLSFTEVYTHFRTVLFK